LASDQRAATEEALRRDEQRRTVVAGTQTGFAVASVPASLGRKSEETTRRRDPSVTLAAKQIKISLVIDSRQLIDLVVPPGAGNVFFEVKAGEGNAAIKIIGRLNPKTVRRAVGTIGELGPDRVACLLQGQLLRNGRVEAAGLAVQPKAKPAGASGDNV
jgi:hypothetical protein